MSAEPFCRSISGNPVETREKKSQISMLWCHRRYGVNFNALINCFNHFLSKKCSKFAGSSFLNAFLCFYIYKLNTFGFWIVSHKLLISHLKRDTKKQDVSSLDHFKARGDQVSLDFLYLCTTDFKKARVWSTTLTITQFPMRHSARYRSTEQGKPSGTSSSLMLLITPVLPLLWCVRCHVHIILFC